MEQKFEFVGSRRDLIQALEDELRKQKLVIHQEYEDERDKKKIAVLKQAGFSIEQVREISDSLQGNREVSFYFDFGIEDQDFEDDGAIHVRRKGIRFVRQGRESELQGFARKVEKAMKTKGGQD